MANKDSRPLISKGSRRIVALGTPSTATLIGNGMTIIPAPSGDKTYQLANPARGVVAEVIVDMNSTKVVTIQTNSSAQTFFGSTTDRLALSTGQGCVQAKFVGVSTSQWAPVITSKSTAALGSFSASTR